MEIQVIITLYLIILYTAKKSCIDRRPLLIPDGSRVGEFSLSGSSILDKTMPMNRSHRFKQMESFIASTQEEICDTFTSLNDQSFIEEEWQRPGGGGGKSRLYVDGSLLEKGGVNISSVYGLLTDEVAKKLRIQVDEFAACGISVVIHPHSPHIPTIHLNLRYFETGSGDAWYGGGIDLTPYVPYEEDFRHFHFCLAKACEAAQPGSYAPFKRECDAYFTLRHRREMRGIGGVFFDYLRDDPDKQFLLIQKLGEAFLPSYLPIVERRKETSVKPEEREFQRIRRGRYVEFNLLYDRGTLFGLKTNGRTESIFMSLPNHASFPSNWKPIRSFEKKMTSYYQPQDWIDAREL